MNRTGKTERLNTAKFNRSASVETQRAMLSLSWYASVPVAAAHLTLSRVSAPRVEGGPRLWARVWVAMENTGRPSARLAC